MDCPITRLNNSIKMIQLIGYKGIMRKKAGARKLVQKKVGAKKLVQKSWCKKKKHLREMLLYRNDWIRTNDHYNPIVVLYQTEPHSEVLQKYKFPTEFQFLSREFIKKTRTTEVQVFLNYI